MAAPASCMAPALSMALLLDVVTLTDVSYSDSLEYWLSVFFLPQIPESFADCLGGLLSVTGQNISLKLEAQGQNSITEVHTGKVVTWKTKNKWCDILLASCIQILLMFDL